MTENKNQTGEERLDNGRSGKITAGESLAK